MRTALLTCQLAACVRFAGYVAAPSAWWLLPFEAGHGYSFALLYSVQAMLAEEYAGLGLQAYVLGVCNSAQQVGAVLATLIWSGLITAAGLHAAFTAAAVFFAVVATPLLLPSEGGGAACAAAARLVRRRRAARLLGRAVRRSDHQDAVGSELPPTGPS